MEVYNVSSSSSATLLTDAPVDGEKFKYISIVYVVVGAILVLVNGLLVVNLLRHSVLRAKKEYILVAGLAVSDLLLGLTTANGGIYELKLMIEHKENEKVDRITCLWTPFFLIKTFATPAEACMLLIMSVDRLIAVLIPLKYATFSWKYSLAMIGIPFLLGSISTVFLLLHLVLERSTETVNPFCLLSIMGKIYITTNVYIRFSLAALSVIIYIIVWYLYRRYHLNMSILFPTSCDRLRKAQKKLTITVGVCVLFTFLLYLVPTTIAILRIGRDATIDWMSLCWIFINLNAVVNVFVYSLRHEDIRQGLKLLFLCKELPSPARQRLYSESQQSRGSATATGRAALLTMRAISASAMLTRVVPAKLFRETARSSA